MTDRIKVLIMGAAGRDFHNFNVVFRDDPTHEVVAFTATQIPYINDRRYPPELAGPLYPDGIPIRDESELADLCREHGVQEVVFAYSDVPYEYVMHRSAQANALGADFRLLGPDKTMIRSSKPVIAVCAVRTGSGKSQTSRKIQTMLRAAGKRVVSIRHPMPYGDLAAQAVQRYATYEDLERYQCTIEEREEYEPHIGAGTVVYAGVDYQAILEAAQQEADVLIWDGGNNDFPFLHSDLLIALTDALRPEDGDRYHPGEAVLRMADAVIVAKTNAATPEQIAQAEAQVRELNPDAALIRGASPVVLDDPAAVRGKRVLVVDDGPTLTHGGMPYGAGFVAASEAGALIVSPLDYAVPAIRDALATYPHIRHVLPALGYGAEQLEALRESIAAAPVDAIVSGTPIDLAALIDVPQPIVRARYEYEDTEGEPSLTSILDATVERLGLGAR